MESNLQSASMYEVNAIIRANWSHLAFLAYKYYLGNGKGCFVFIDGLKDVDAFNQTSGMYTPVDELIEFFSGKNVLSDEMIQIARAYDPETSLVAYVFQHQYPCFVYLGDHFGLPRPKDIWEQLKDDPMFNR